MQEDGWQYRHNEFEHHDSPWPLVPGLFKHFYDIHLFNRGYIAVDKDYAYIA